MRPRRLRSSSSVVRCQHPSVLEPGEERAGARDDHVGAPHPRREPAVGGDDLDRGARAATSSTIRSSAASRPDASAEWTCTPSCRPSSTPGGATSNTTSTAGPPTAARHCRRASRPRRGAGTVAPPAVGPGPITLLPSTRTVASPGHARVTVAPVTVGRSPRSGHRRCGHAGRGHPSCGELGDLVVAETEHARAAPRRCAARRWVPVRR